MAKPVEARRIAEQVLVRAKRQLGRAVKDIAERIAPDTLEEAGKMAVKYSIATHTFNNRTFNLETSYAYKVLKPNSSGEFAYNTITGPESFTVGNESSQIVLFYGAGAHYARYVELNHGFDVAVQTHLFFRHEGMKLLGNIMKAKRVDI